MDSSERSMTNSFYTELTDDLTKLARINRNRRLGSQFDPLDLVQMAWKSALMTQQDSMARWERKRVRSYLRGILLNKLKVLHRSFLDLEKRDLRKQVHLEICVDARCQDTDSAYHAKTGSVYWHREVLIQQMLDELNENEARIIKLKLHGCSLAEIAEQTGLNRRSIQRAVIRIRKRFENRWNDLQ